MTPLPPPIQNAKPQPPRRKQPVLFPKGDRTAVAKPTATTLQLEKLLDASTTTTKKTAKARQRKAAVVNRVSLEHAAPTTKKGAAGSAATTAPPTRVVYPHIRLLASSTSSSKAGSTGGKRDVFGSTHRQHHLLHHRGSGSGLASLSAKHQQANNNNNNKIVSQKRGSVPSRNRALKKKLRKFSEGKERKQSVCRSSFSCTGMGTVLMSERAESSSLLRERSVVVSRESTAALPSSDQVSLEESMVESDESARATKITRTTKASTLRTVAAAQPQQPQPMVKNSLCGAGRMAAHPHKRRRIASRHSVSVAVLTSTASASNNNNDENSISLTLPAPGTCDAAASSSASSSNTDTESKQAISSLDQPTPFITTITTTKPPLLSTVNAASQAIPRPESAKASQHSKSNGTGGGGNYVKLNMRNKAGSCRGARNTKAKSKAKQLWEERKQQNLNRNRESSSSSLFASVSGSTAVSGVDPVDDFVDGAYSTTTMTTNDDEPSGKKSKGKATVAASTIPLCNDHQQPCKLLTVKKSGPNKGRKFYVCPCPRSEQCNHFGWADDTIQAARTALLKNTSVSGFIARQVASYMTHCKCLTIPELQKLLKQHGLSSVGKKPQLLARLSIWVRDEISIGTTGTVLASSDDSNDNNNGAGADDDTNASAHTKDPQEEGMSPVAEDENKSDIEDDDSSSSSSSDEEELELFGEKPDQSILSQHSSILQETVWPLRKSPVSRPSEPSTDTSDSETEEEAPVSGKTRNADTTSTMYSTLQTLFGHNQFRDGQEWAIRRCLDKRRSLLVAPTGFGKSLCFSLPAAMMEGVCIVVSPLLSLIQDQIRVLPARLPAVTLSGPMSTASMTATLDDIKRGRIKILFVSPERLTSASFRRLFRPVWNGDSRAYERIFPTVSLFCVDEAHCLSQWAHNFRPSYLRLHSMVNMIQPLSVLAVTATAGPRVVTDICRTLNIQHSTKPLEESTQCDNESLGVRISKTDRDNIDVRCYMMDSQEERLSRLIKILTNDKTDMRTKTDDSAHVDGCLSSGSVIVYVWRQRDADVVAENIQASGVNGGVVVYHGGMDSHARMKAQSKFMRGKVRICVATIAFGLGINKADVAGVIHLYLSSSPEHYIQEIGRAGRNGRPAVAIALVLKEEVLVRHSLAQSDLISKSQVEALLLFLCHNVEESFRHLPATRSKRLPVSVSFPLAVTVLGCDCKPETAETILSLLEQRNGREPLLMIEGIFYDNATIAPRRRHLKELAATEPIARALLACAKCCEQPAGEKGEIVEDEDQIFESSARESKLVGQTFGSYSFSVAQCSNCLGESAEPRHVFAALRRLEARGEIQLVLDTAPKDRSLNIRMTPEGMRVFESENKQEIAKLVSATYERFTSTISVCANKVLDIDLIMRSVSNSSFKSSTRKHAEKSQSLVLFQSLIRQYFEADGKGKSLAASPNDLPAFCTDLDARQLSADAQTVLTYLQEVQGTSNSVRLLRLGDPSTIDFTALLIAKFLHGLAPASISPSLIRQHHLFGKKQRTRFADLLDVIYKLFRPE